MNGNIVVADFSSRILLNDFEKEVRRVDRQVFEAGGYSMPIVLQGHVSDRPLYQRRGFSVGNFVSYVPLARHSRSERATQKLVTLHQSLESYIIWIEPSVSWIDEILIGGRLSGGDGHKAIKDRWFFLSCILVRARILFHPAWFPDMRMRTQKTLIQHRDLFGVSGDDLSGLRMLHQQFSLSAKALKHDDMQIDIYWTMELFRRAMERVGKERALSLLHSDVY